MSYDSEYWGDQAAARGYAVPSGLPVRATPTARLVGVSHPDAMTLNQLFRQAVSGASLPPAERPKNENLRQRLQREKDELEVALAEVAGRLARRRSQLQELDKYPEVDPFEDGAILRFEKTFPMSEKLYSYVAHKADGLWYLSGSRAPQGISWDRFVDFMGIGVQAVYHVNAVVKGRSGPPKQHERKVIG